MNSSETKSIRDLSVEEFKALVETVVRDAIEDEIEDRAALNSPAYLSSIVEARKEFAEGEVKSFSELFPNV